MKHIVYEPCFVQRRVMFNKKNVAHGNKETGVLERQETVDVSFPKGKSDIIRVCIKVKAMVVALTDMDDRLERVETSTTKLENIVFKVVMKAKK